MEFIFWFMVALLIYLYLGYLMILVLAGKLFGKPVKKKQIGPSVSIVIAAYNEEKHIKGRIDNCLAFDYPKEKLEIIIISDGSTDQTNEILKSYSSDLVKITCLDKRSGKTNAQNIGVKAASNEILFFTDATTVHPPEALKLLVANFNDESVGCATGRFVFKEDKGATSKGLKKRNAYELFLRKKQSELYTLFGASGCIYAIPRKLYVPLREDLDSDYVEPLEILRKGFRSVYEPEALAYVDRPAPNSKEEFMRRSRIVLLGLRGTFYMKELMNPLKHGLLSISFVSQRVLRWLSPIYLIILYFSNFFLLENKFYQVTFLLQNMFYMMAILVYFLDKKGKRVASILYLPFYFCLVMLSAAEGIRKLLRGETGQIWDVVGR